MPEGEHDGELVGRVLGGRYRVTAVLGRGGMGVVGRAVDELLGREVAVKLLRSYTDASAPELADLRARMQREAQAAARIRHAGVVTVHDVTEEQGRPVIVMELVEGPSLDDLLARRGPLDPREAAAIGAKLMDALDAAHRVGVLHRDVKPGNVLLEQDGGRVVLTDFGIASVETAEEEAQTKLTRAGEIVGSLDYLPPERAQGREPGPASDIWALGMTLYAAVEGTSPFRRTSVWSTLSAIVSDPLPPPHRAGPLTPVLQALMAKRPEDRPTAEQARAMLERVAAGIPAGAHTAALEAPVFAAPMPPTPVPTAPVPPAPVLPSPVPPPGSFGPPAGTRPTVAPQHGGGPDAVRPRRRGRTAVVAVASAVVLAGGGIAYAVTHGKGGGPGPRAAHSGTAASGAGAPGASPAPATPGKPAGGPTAKPGATAKTGTPPKASVSPAAKPTTVSTSCTGWSHRDPAPGSFGYMSGDFHIVTGPYQNCPAVSLAKKGTKLVYQCFVVNAHGNKWTYVRVPGSKVEGWMSNDNLTRQSGPSAPC
ncbi:serine/threonine-protein kinase [Streptomyces sp. NPDC085524]|uniref:serine/threonine-protein kinase n=1 Tax=unclassified Streptomyces TaxID=2593676 RepID=UPI003690241E